MSTPIGSIDQLDFSTRHFERERARWQADAWWTKRRLPYFLVLQLTTVMCIIAAFATPLLLHHAQVILSLGQMLVVSSTVLYALLLSALYRALALADQAFNTRGFVWLRRSILTVLTVLAVLPFALSMWSLHQGVDIVSVADAAVSAYVFGY